MLVLILAIASFLFFILVVTLLAIASTLESRTLRRKRILRLTKPLALLSINDAFDPIYSVLWQAPIAALAQSAFQETRMVRSHGKEPIGDEQRQAVGVMIYMNQVMNTLLNPE